MICSELRETIGLINETLNQGLEVCYLVLTPTNSNIASCPTIQLNSECNYPELASDSTGLKALSCKTTLTSEASCKGPFPRLLMLLSDMAAKLGIPMALLLQVTDDCFSLGCYDKSP